MSIKVEGELIARLEKREGTSASGKDWVSRTIVVKTNEDYPQEIAIDFFGEDKVSLLENLTKGQSISVECNLRGREHQGRWYVSLGGWRINSDTQEPVKEEERTTDNVPF